ncbi:MAG: DinB family protein [Actinomycetota bacterium]|nr:DinB family protein [Actinomycetota bacterium]
MPTSALSLHRFVRHNGHADVLRELVDGTVGW